MLYLLHWKPKIMLKSAHQQYKYVFPGAGALKLASLKNCLSQEKNVYPFTCTTL